MVYGENEIVINIGFELANITIEMIESDNEQHCNSRCYPVDADSARVYS